MEIHWEIYDVLLLDQILQSKVMLASNYWYRPAFTRKPLLWAGDWASSWWLDQKVWVYLRIFQKHRKDPEFKSGTYSTANSIWLNYYPVTLSIWLILLRFRKYERKRVLNLISNVFVKQLLQISFQKKVTTAFLIGNVSWQHPNAIRNIIKNDALRERKLWYSAFPELPKRSQNYCSIFSS